MDQTKAPLDEERLAANYNLHKLSVHQATQISTRVQNVIQFLEAKPEDDGKPSIVVLTAKNRAVGKLVSITEIAKRDLKTKNVNCFQYTSLSSVTVDIKRQPEKAKGANGELDANAAEDEQADDGDSAPEEAFQTMGESQVEGTKKRAVPVITVYLATSAVKALKEAYGTTVVTGKHPGLPEEAAASTELALRPR